ncbi:alpha/beta fold hydrolase [Halorhodospira neutriphila]|uniref:alpha/beta fold hydrolase n=1 Tax=Halorhodospira neutriphila TaxID=168379 RepID=UPI0030845016
MSSSPAAASPPAAPADGATLEPGAIRAADGYALPLRRWGPPGDEAVAVVLGLHGLNDYSNGLAVVAEQLAAAGIATYAYDQCGFGATRDAGRWPGAERLVDDAETALALLRRRHPEAPLYLLGQSMGAAVATILAAERGLGPAAGLVLVAPALWACETMPWYQRLGLRLSARLPGRLQVSSAMIAIEPTDNPRILAAMRDDPLIQRWTRLDVLEGVTGLMGRALAASAALYAPALVLYGEHDRVIPPAPIRAMLRCLPPRPPGRWRLALYPDGYHMLTRDRQGERVNADIATWLTAPRGAPLPSGLELDREAALERLGKRRRRPRLPRLLSR